MREKVVLAYSGGLDTSIIIPWLKENYDCDVIAYVADVGQGDDLDAVVEKAYATGASKVIVEDLRQEFLTGLRLSRNPGGCGVRAQVSAGHVAGATDHREVSGQSRIARRLRPPWRTAAPARATIRCASSMRIRRWRLN